MKTTDEGTYWRHTEAVPVGPGSRAQKIVTACVCKQCGWDTGFRDYHPEAYVAIIRHHLHTHTAFGARS